MKHFLRLLLFLVTCNFIFWSCSPTNRIANHMNRISKIQEKFPETRGALDTSFSEYIDTTYIEIKELKEQTVLLMDTISFDSLVEELTRLETSLLLEGNQSQKRSEIIHQLRKGAYKDTTFTIYLEEKYTNKDSVYVKFININVSFINGKLLHSIDSLVSKIKTSDVEVNISIQKDFSFWIWLKDEKTLFLIGIIVIFIGITLVYFLIYKKIF